MERGVREQVQLSLSMNFRKSVLCGYLFLFFSNGNCGWNVILNEMI